MIAAPRADAGQVGDNGDAVVSQLLGGPDSREKQQVWRHHRARAQHDLGAVEDLDGARAFDLHSDGPTVVEHHPPRRYLALDREVGPVAMRGDVGHCGIHPNSVNDVAGQGAIARGAGPVLVELLRESEVRTRGEERLAQLMMLGRRRSRDRHRSASTVKLVIAKVAIVLEAPQERQDRGERPCVVAERSPSIEVAWRRADEDSAVDRARPTHHLAARHRDAPRVGQPGVEPPVGGVSIGSAGHRRRVEQLSADEVGSRLEQQHRTARGPH